MILECKNCEALVNAEEIAHYTYEAPDDFPADVITVFLWKCPKCGHPLVTDYDDFLGVNILFPPLDNRVNQNLPEPIKASYTEALSCFKAKAYTATAIMCRKTLEGICAEHSVTGNNLVKNLKELKDKGIIENRLYEWADALRISGNEAAHDVKVTISAEDARDILEFTNALLEYIFTFRDRFEKFKKRRSAKSSKQRDEA